MPKQFASLQELHGLYILLWIPMARPVNVANVANNLPTRDGFRVEHRTGLPCSKLEIIEFDRADPFARLELDMLEIESLCVFGGLLIMDGPCHLNISMKSSALIKYEMERQHMEGACILFSILLYRQLLHINLCIDFFFEHFEHFDTRSSK